MKRHDLPTQLDNVSLGRVHWEFESQGEGGQGQNTLAKRTADSKAV